MNEIRYTIRLLYLPVRGPYRNVQQRHLLSDRKIYISRSSETTSSIFQNNLVVQFGVFLPSAHNESRGHGSVGITLSSVQAHPMNYTSFFLQRNFMEPPRTPPEVVISYEIIDSGTLGRLGFLLRVRKNRALELRLWYNHVYLPCPELTSPNPPFLPLYSASGTYYLRGNPTTRCSPKQKSVSTFIESFTPATPTYSYHHQYQLNSQGCPQVCGTIHSF